MSDSEFSVQRQLDAICDEFEENWSAFKESDIASKLGRIGGEPRDRLLKMLIEIDVELRRKAGQTILPEDYEELGNAATEIVAEAIAEHSESTLPLSPSPAEPQEHLATNGSLSGSPTPTAGRELGPYKLLQQIGEGGMGSVWMAEQAKPVRRRVALKVIKAGMDSKQVIARFEAERQALSMMDHPNIAKVLDAGMTEDGRPYFAMELVQGIPFTQYCDRNKLTPNERLELFVPICQAIQHAHQKGIIHRDIKPSNVLVTLYDGKPVPKVIDFGLAKALQHEHKLTDKTMFTEFGQVVGTLQYMSPEQAEMNALDVDTRTDVYSLGVMLYELLTGSTPLDRKSMIRMAQHKILEQIREKDPPRPSTRLTASGDAITVISATRKIAPIKLQQILRGELDWIVMKALEKDRTRRYETANGLAIDIRRYLEGDAIDARPPSVGYRVSKFARKNRGLVTSVAAILTLLIAGIGGTSWFAYLSNQYAVNEQKQRKKAQEAEIQVRHALTKAEDAIRVAKNKETQLAAQVIETQQAITETEFALYSNRLANALLHIRTGNFFDARKSLQESDVETKGLEHEIIFAEFDKSQKTYSTVSSNELYSTCASHDGDILFAVGKNQAVILKDGEQTELTFERNEIFTSCVIVELRNLVVAGAISGRIYAWNTQTFELEFQLGDDTGFKNFGYDRQNWMTIAMHPNNKSIVSGVGKNVTVWDIEKRTAERLFIHNREITSLAITHDGEEIVVADWQLTALNFFSGDVFAKTESSRATVRSVTCLQDGQVIVGNDAGELLVFDRNLKQKLAREEHRSIVNCLCVDESNSFAYTGGSDGLCIQWNLKDFTKARELAGHSGEITSIVILPQHNILQTSSTDKTIKQWNLNRPETIETREYHSPSRVAFTSTSIGRVHTIADHVIEISKVDNPEKSRRVELTESIAGESFSIISPDGKHVVLAKTDGQIDCIEIDTSKKIFEFKLERPCEFAVFSGDSELLAVLSRNGDVSVWNLNTGNRKYFFPDLASFYYILKFAPNNESLFFATKDGVVKSINLSSGLVEDFVNTDSESLWSITLSNAGDIVAIGAEDYVRFYEFVSKKLIAEMKCHNGPVRSMDFGKDDKLFATAGRDGLIKVWDLETKALVDSIVSVNSAVFVQFSIDGNSLFCAWSSAGKFKKYDLEESRILWELGGGTAQISISEDQQRVMYRTSSKMEVFELTDPKHDPSSENRILELNFGYKHQRIESIVANSKNDHLFAGLTDFRTWNLSKISLVSDKVVATKQIEFSPEVLITLPTGNLICSDGDSVSIFDDSLENNPVQFRFAGRFFSDWEIQTSNDGKRISRLSRLSVDRSDDEESKRVSHLVVYDLDTASRVFEKEFDVELTAHCFGKSESEFFFTSGNELIVFDLETKEFVRQTVGGSRKLLAVAHDKDSNRILTGDSGGNLTFWDSDRLHPITSVKTKLGWVRKISIKDHVLSCTDQYSKGQLWLIRKLQDK